MIIPSQPLAIIQKGITCFSRSNRVCFQYWPDKHTKGNLYSKSVNYWQLWAIYLEEDLLPRSVEPPPGERRGFFRRRHSQRRACSLVRLECFMYFKQWMVKVVMHDNLARTILECTNASSFLLKFGAINLAHTIIIQYTNASSCLFAR